ncbi:MAG: VanW family protein, partial [Eisenbergiella sp.]
VHTTGLGGGVCQISSTVYNAVKNAGLTVTERKAHSMPVSYLPKGLDAAIAAGSKDLKFRNDYSTPVVLYTDTANKRLTINVVVWNQELAGRSFKLWAKQTGSLSADTYFTTYQNGKETSTVFVGTSRYLPYREEGEEE